jgi:diadenosine tetraphosphate (Ap4A) HIT family hydrolase
VPTLRIRDRAHGGRGPRDIPLPPLPARAAGQEVVPLMGPFDRFNDRAKRVLALAQDEAIRFNHNYIGVEHLLLGLMREGEGVAAKVLQSLGVELAKARTAVEFVIGRGDSATPPNDITLTPRVKKVIELAIDEAKKLGHSHVGTEHLLLGMVREGGSIGTGVLESLGVSLEKVRQQVIQTLGQQAPVGMRARRDPRFDKYYDAQGKKRDWFCEDVLSGKLEVQILHQDDRVMAFHHPDPDATLHVVIIPKAHVAGLLATEALDPALMGSVMAAIQEVARLLGLRDRGFFVRANAATPDVTPHMHWHVMGPGLAPERTHTP